MLKVERQDKITEICALRGTATVHEIASTLGVSEMTVRRDLMELADEGRVIRFHGGAKIVEDAHGKSLVREASRLEKRLRNASKKLCVARAAAELVEEGDTVFLGSSTTIELMAQRLPPVGLRVVTNSLPVFNLFADDEEHEVILVGGTYRARTGAFGGPLAEEMLSSLGFDKAFIGVNGILDDSLFTSNAEPGRLQHLAFDRAAERYVLADSSKMGVRDFYCFYSLRNVDAVVVDPGVSADDLLSLEKHTRVICPRENTE
ncbi:MAG: DeoR/GlpR family DNA-binding transcription regulator [Coriobacteriaceae bacterium]|nr:DeoR/GlpR family DNA-binding transcription regulator [Coriobacteriaceae bacterium]MCI6843375.1 DeoR/GlpR family DNA-binding transcription regulator [Coriobacteriaceae bacterium]MCI7438168.1 DeoR/GlpR family DNA-binding transcription regulator [Coriobacteriaceae bacterium]MDD7584469.1 DeoR/GlpR family DNA-binding transcription regulator [Coriobacteriaceae bacterium]